MPRLYGCYRSRATRNLWLKEEAGFGLDLVTVWQAYRLDEPEAEGAPLNTRSPAFLALSPMGSIPVLEDDGLVLTESLAINLHLARTRGGDLGPRDAAETAEMEQWALFAATAIEETALVIQNAHLYGRAGTEEGRAEVVQAAGRLERPLRALAARTAGRDWLVGGRFTVADINMAEILRYAQGEPGVLPGPLRAYLERCQARPAFERMWARREAEPARP